MSICTEKKVQYIDGRIENLSSRTEVYKIQVNSIGGVCIGIIFILIAVMAYLFIKVSKLKQEFKMKLDEVDPLRRFAITRGQIGQEYIYDPSLVPNRFHMAETSRRRTIEVANPTGHIQNRLNDDFYVPNGRNNIHKPIQTPTSFLHRIRDASRRRVPHSLQEDIFQ